MKAIEKAMLIKELHQLIDGLEHQPLSFFEIARSKKRIREIFALCDEPIFQKQLEAYKALTQPQAAAERWIQQSPYQHAYIGLFQYESALTDALKQQAAFAWGVLYKSGLGWQIVFQNTPTTLYSSPWHIKFEHAYQWFLSHAQSAQQPENVPFLTTPETSIEVAEVARDQFFLPVTTTFDEETSLGHAQDNVITDAFVFTGIELLSIATDDTSAEHPQDSKSLLPKVSPESSLLLSKAEAALHFNTEIQPTFDSNLNATQIEESKLRSFKQDAVEDVVSINPIKLSIKQDKEPENQIDIVQKDLDLQSEVLAENHLILSNLSLLSNELCPPQEESIIDAVVPIRFDLKPSASISTLAIQDFIQRRSILADPQDTDISSESHQQNPLEGEATAPCPAMQDSHTENSETSATATQPLLPTQINLGQYQAQLHTLHQPNLDPKLYGLDISGHIEINQNIEFLIHSDQLDHCLDYPIYLAEQTHQHGRFIKYLALFGADSPTEAIRLSQQFAQSCQHQLAAIREIEWDQLQTHMHDVFSIFQLYTQQAKLVWHIEDYHPFILADLLNSRKFIHFKESPADVNTPILVLKERQKIRVIHGQKRVELSRTEIAYPCLVLDRQHGVSWQLIQNTISTLPEPITVFQLFDSIQKQLSSEL